jgi:hypothetical protein
LRRDLRLLASTIAAATALLVGPESAAAAPFSLITNGGFESALSGWTSAGQPGGAGAWFSQTGTSSPLNLFAVPTPPSGTFAAMTDQSGPSAQVLYQDFVVPSGVTLATLSFSEYVNNQNGVFFNASTLDFSSGSNQQARVDLIDPLIDSNPFTTSAAAVLLNVFHPTASNLFYNSMTVDVTSLLQAHAGGTLRLRFAETDNQYFFNFGVDNVSLSGQRVPEPASLTLVALGAIGLMRRGLRRG